MLYSSQFFPHSIMRKMSVLLGSVGGALAGYVFSNKKLRNELMAAKDANAAARILGKHLSSDGGQVAKEVKQLAMQHHWDDKVAEGKKYVMDYYKSSAKEAQKMFEHARKEAMKMVKKTTKKVMKKK